MASNINFADINANYPVAGQDNDSQGFRDNFNVIKNSLQAAKTEVSTLQDDTVKLNADNDLNGSKIENAELISNYETVHPNGNITSTQNISWSNGHYQTIQAGADITLTLADWPDSGTMGRMRLQITGDNNPREITFSVEGGGSLKTDDLWPTKNEVNVSKMMAGAEYEVVSRGDTSWGDVGAAADIQVGQTFTAAFESTPTGTGVVKSTGLYVNSSTDPVIIDLWTINQGTTVFAKYHGSFS